MALYAYVKTQYQKSKKMVSALSFLFIFSGVIILSWTLLPILTFELFYAPKFGNVITPLPNEIIKYALENELPQVLGTSTDYTKASGWFPEAENVKVNMPISSYTLTLPKLNIDKAIVSIDGDDLYKSLIHFAGPLPGNPGNPVIIGHSTIPWFYNPKDYKSIFSKLPSLEKGDDIFLTIDDVTYQYKVYEMRITVANNLSVLDQNYDNAYITLITCVPPGTYFKRLIVKGKLVNI